MKTKKYNIVSTFAIKNKIACQFTAIALRETEKAVYLYGKSTNAEEIIDQWIPKKLIKSEKATKEIITLPKNHKISTIKNVRKASKIKYESGVNAIKLEFTFDPALVKEIKTLEYRKFHNEKNKKFWTCRLSAENVKILKRLQFSFNDELSEFDTFTNTPFTKITPIEVPNLNFPLRDYQKIGVAFFEKKNGRALNADDMGLGKTIQSIAYCALHPELRPAVILCPSVMKEKWRAELKKWLTIPSSIQILQGETPEPIENRDFIIINYDILANKYVKGEGSGNQIEIKNTGWVDFIIRTSPKLLIADECHYFKNNKSYRTKAVKKLTKKIKHIIMLSGTPIENKPIEIWNVVHILSKDIFSNFIAFGKKFCDGKHTGFGWDFSGASNLEEFHKLLTNTVMIRRKKENVLKELPDKSFSYVPMSLTNENEYYAALCNLKEYLHGKNKEWSKDGETLTKLTILKKLTSEGKINDVIDWVTNFLESGEKLVIFGWYKSTLSAIEKKFPGCIKVDGSTKNKAELISRFQTDPNCKLFVGQMKACGIGIELTSASHIAVIDLCFTPGILDQAIDRCHRMGQLKKVVVYYLLAKNNIESHLIKLLDQKRLITKQILDGKQIEDINVINELINNIISNK